MTINYLEWVKTIIGPLVTLGGFFFAIWRAKTEIQFKYDQDQKNLLYILRGELSANIYLLLDHVFHGEPRKFSVERRIFDANASRAGNLTSRAFAWLSVLYSRLIDLDPDVGHSLHGHRLKLILGHAILMKAGIDILLLSGKRATLSEISDEEFVKSIKDFMSEERSVLESARKEWIQSIKNAGRS